MLTFLAIACKQKFLDSYEAEAVGHMEKNADGKMAITRVDLCPKITWSGDRIPSAEELDKLRHPWDGGLHRLIMYFAMLD
jgi:hypothetical protein